MRFRSFSVFAGSLLLLALGVTSAQAQVWRQTVQVIATVRYDDPLGIFADSLSVFLAQNPTTMVRRSAQDPVAIPFGELQEQLYEDGVEVRSVTHALVRYRFDLNRRWQLVETIEDVNFIYRADESQPDLAILHVDFRDSALGPFLQERGILSPINMASIMSFRRLLSFPALQKDPALVIAEIGQEVLRDDGFTPQQQVVLRFLSGHSEMSPRAYVLARKK